MRKIIVLCGFMILSLGIMVSCLKAPQNTSEVSTINVGLPDEIISDVEKTVLDAKSNKENCSRTEEASQSGETQLELDKTCFPYTFTLTVWKKGTDTSSAETCWYKGSKDVEQAEGESIDVIINLGQDECKGGPQEGSKEIEAKITTEKVNAKITGVINKDNTDPTPNTPNTPVTTNKTLSSIANGTLIAVGGVVNTHQYHCRAFRTNNIDASKISSYTSDIGTTCKKVCGELSDSMSKGNKLSEFYGVCSSIAPTSSGLLNWELSNNHRIFKCSYRNTWLTSEKKECVSTHRAK